MCGLLIHYRTSTGQPKIKNQKHQKNQVKSAYKQVRKFFQRPNLTQKAPLGHINNQNKHMQIGIVSTKRLKIELKLLAKSISVTCLVKIHIIKLVVIFDLGI